MGWDRHKGGNMKLTKKVKPSAEHIRARESLIFAMRKEMATMTAEEVLVIVSHLLGQIIALQDQRKYTSAMVMELVEKLACKWWGDL